MMVNFVLFTRERHIIYPWSNLLWGAHIEQTAIKGESMEVELSFA